MSNPEHKDLKSESNPEPKNPVPPKVIIKPEAKDPKSESDSNDDFFVPKICIAWLIGVKDYS